ncbi:MAG: polyribonucleotide nucleotidyltransferase [Chloroflexi bacterium]|nr:polyribonucleotide nucleotidyltransferase [Chloroflexota bacterium]
MAYRVEKMIGGRLMIIETGKLADQAGGAVMVEYGDTVVLMTACMTAPREGIDFFPLTVDYEERLYAAGKIPGGYIKREGRPSQEAVLACRLTDRAIRPLFPKGFNNEVQVIATVLSADQENDPAALALIGASASLGISEIPFEGPVSAVKVGYVDNRLVLNPTLSELNASKVDLVLAGTRDGIVMIEAGAQEVPEKTLLEAMEFGLAAVQEINDMQEELRYLVGKPKVSYQPPPINKEVELAVGEILGQRLPQIMYKGDKAVRDDLLKSIFDEVVGKLGSAFPADDLRGTFDAAVKKEVRTTILEKGLRPDGRDLDTIRPICCEVGVLPRTHGSGLFTRGQTQVLSIVTLGSLGEEQRIDGLGIEETRRFMHHYNFPPFSTGEVKRVGTPGRREIGHGALAGRALEAVIPDEAHFPYTIRIVSEVLSSNGSTSMASVCGSSLAMMDAGIPIKAPVAGVAMGLIVEGDGRFGVLTDILGMEDALGDMDFKVAGTADGVTALQMDIKVKNVSPHIMEEALERAHRARMFILDKMRATIGAARPELSKYAPKMTKITINPDKIRFVIGPGGKNIRAIVAETKASIDVENDGTVVIGSASEEATQKAIQMIERLTRDVEVGGIYTGTVTRTTNFGAFVEILPGKEGLVHISELAEQRVPNVDEVVKVGDEITVMVTEIDRMGRVNLSRRAVLQGAKRPEVRMGVPDRHPRPTSPRRHS